MSEPMTTVEIEDVLSSIRRLVSEDLRPTHKLVSAALQNGASKLILTPALRIVADVRGALPEGGDALADPRDLATVLHDLEPEVDAPAADFMPVFGSVRQAAADAPGRDGPASGEFRDANFLATAMSRINGLARADGHDGVSESIEAVVAAVGAAVGPEEWEPDGGEPAPQSQALGGEAWDEAWGGGAEWNSADQGEADQGPVAVATPEPAVLVLVAEQVAPAPQEAADLIEQDRIVFHQPVSAAGEDPGESAADDDADEFTDFLTEDVLREIVRDMIREELQGNLGERITRNVRKLVRAEINRAMASRDFDDVASQR